jgi:hypothetical protein
MPVSTADFGGSGESARIESAPKRAFAMLTREITIRVAPDVANAYLDASEEERRKLDLLLSLRLQDVMRRGESLDEVIRDVSEKAQARGLTPEVLTSILNDQ